ncbi:hypothetical protein [Dysgonomonas sp. 25]|uniref:hypothetical protein n=1 Tax=Dysgonomonas sp. 25 TaxID=2302933 RepID=UPI0013D854CE|nr:hypothetical protein [Dysgonomonas sp. 25]
MKNVFIILYLALVVILLNSCLFSDTDKHPEYPDLFATGDSIGYPLQLLSIDNEAKIADNIPYFRKRTIRDTDYYYTPMTSDLIPLYYDGSDEYSIDDISAKLMLGDSYGIFSEVLYNQKGELALKYNTLDITGKKHVDILQSGITKEGYRVFSYNPEQEDGDSQFFIYDAKRNKIVDTIHIFSYWELYDMPAATQNDSTDQNQIIWRDRAKRLGVPLCEYLPYPDERDFPQDSIGQELLNEARMKHLAEQEKIDNKYLKDFIKANHPFVYKESENENRIIDMRRKIALYYNKSDEAEKEAEKLPLFIYPYTESGKSVTDSLFTINQDDSSIYAYSGGTGRFSLWNTNYMYYYSLVYQQSDTIRFKSLIKGLTIDNYTKSGDQYILILNRASGQEYLFFVYSPKAD